MGTNDFYAINTLRKAYLHKYFIINLMECQAAIIFKSIPQILNTEFLIVKFDLTPLRLQHFQ